MKISNLLKNLAVILLLVFMANGVVSAKVASGPQNLGSGLHQIASWLEAAPRLGWDGFSYDEASGFSVVAKRTFTSTDKHVADVANKIEEAYPGHVVGVNVPVRDTAGNMVTDADILLKNAVIQVKSGGGKGMTSQLQRTEQATGLPTIGYGPDLKQSILKNNLSTNDLQTLIDVVKP